VRSDEEKAVPEGSSTGPLQPYSYRPLSAIVRITYPSSASGSFGSGVSSACRNARGVRCSGCRQRRSHDGSWKRRVLTARSPVRSSPRTLPSAASPTPAEIYFGRTPAHLSAIPPPRGSPAEGTMDSPFRLEYLDAERMLPVLVRKAACRAAISIAALHFRLSLSCSLFSILLLSPHNLFMELDVPVADDALRPDLGQPTGHRDTELVAGAGLAVVFHRHAEGATVAAGAGKQDRLR
jgi:hypothetical protein